MADFTRKAIIETYISMIERMPASQVTVSALVKECGINRNTFYYHFRDIPDLLETIAETDADSIISSSDPADTLEDCLERAIGFALLRRKAVMNIYSSSSRNIFEVSLWRVVESVVRRYLERRYGDDIPSDRREAVVRYLKCVLFGLVSGWLESGMDKDIILGQLKSIANLKHGSLDDMMQTAFDR